MGDSIKKLSHKKLLLRDTKILLRNFIYRLYVNKVYLFLREGKPSLKNSIKLILKKSVPPSERCQTPHEGSSNYKLYINKESVPLSEGCQTPFKGFY